MATFRAIHPYVRERAFEHGFKCVPGDFSRVQHPTLRGKRAQVAFYRAFAEASAMPGVRRVATPRTRSGTTLLFPVVPEARWDAARRGVKWEQPLMQVQRPARTWPETRAAASPRGRSMHFNGVVDSSGCVVSFQLTTTDDATARTLIEAAGLASRA